MDKLEWSEEDEVTEKWWDEEQEWITVDKVMWEEFLKWKDEKSKKKKRINYIAVLFFCFVFVNLM